MQLQLCNSRSKPNITEETSGLLSRGEKSVRNSLQMNLCQFGTRIFEQITSSHKDLKICVSDFQNYWKSG